MRYVWLLLLALLPLLCAGQKVAGKPAAKKPTTSKTVAKKPAASKPAASSKSATTKKPAAKKSTSSSSKGATSSHPSSPKIKALQQQKVELQNTLKKSEAQLTQTRKQVKEGQQHIKYLDQQLDDRLRYIRRLEGEMEALDAEITHLQTQIQGISIELQIKREKLKQALRYARAQREANSPLLFVLSAKSVTQMYRRARYAREYVTYQHTLGQQILRKQVQLSEAQNQLLGKKSQKNTLLREVMLERKSLGQQQVRQQEKVSTLKKQETGLASKIAEQQKRLKELDKKIDELIAYEIEQARKRAEEEARKKKGSSTGKGGTGSKGGSSSWLTPEERQLSGSFEQNKGRLPVPITGQYMLAGRYGVYNVEGLKNVQLDNKGANYLGKAGARAQSVFDGEVTGVVLFGGTWTVLVRHGVYITVYCNLSSIIVKKGQKVHARDVLGTVANDGAGNYLLHFQVRKETLKLNPEQWIGR